MNKIDTYEISKEVSDILASELSANNLKQKFAALSVTCLSSEEQRQALVQAIEDKCDPLIRQRNMKKEQTLYYNQKKEEVVRLREENPEMSAEAIAKELKVSSSFCKNTLRQEGLFATKYEKEGKETIVRGVKEAKRAYDRNIYAHFGYGPNKGESINRDINSYVRMRDDQHQMNAELRKDRELERCIKLGKGVERLSSRYLESEGKER